MNERSSFYAHETNGIDEFYAMTDAKLLQDEIGTYSCLWNDKRLVKITRFRMLTDPTFPMWDISYVYGLMNIGGQLVNCRVSVPFNQLSRKLWWSEIKGWARRENVNIYKLGIWDAVSKLW